MSTFLELRKSRSGHPPYHDRRTLSGHRSGLRAWRASATISITLACSLREAWERSLPVETSCGCHMARCPWSPAGPQPLRRVHRGTAAPSLRTEAVIHALLVQREKYRDSHARADARASADAIESSTQRPRMMFPTEMGARARGGEPVTRFAWTTIARTVAELYEESACLRPV